MKINNIDWWRTSFNHSEIENIKYAIKNEHISQGKITANFEKKLAKYLKVKNVITVTSGTAALTLLLLSLGIKPNDEIIIPNRTWIATAHSAAILGVKLVIAKNKIDSPIIDEDKIGRLVTNKTKAIIVVNINGRVVNIKKIRKILGTRKIKIIEDASQAMGSKNSKKFIGTIADFGFFSLSVAKMISTGQGGFIVTDSNKFAKNLRLRRTHGIKNINNTLSYPMIGFNFRFNDILSSIGLAQLKLINKRIHKSLAIYKLYEKNLINPDFKLIKVNIKNGEVPVYIEYLVRNRSRYTKELLKKNINIRPFYPDISSAKYLNTQKNNYKKTIFETNGVYLPSGPAQSLTKIKYLINIINSMKS
tara:strand:- start:4844 stop:5929 length:1086 start_codon:yes stop_codon:yes gene_type:complete